jgi:hypothetical protein
MLSAIVQRERVWFPEMSYCSTYLVCSAVSFPSDRAKLIKPATLEQRTNEPVLSFSRVHTIRRSLPVESSGAWAVVPGPCTDVAGSHRVLQGTRQVAFFTRIQLIRAGIDLMNTAYNYLDLTPKGRDERGRGQFWGPGQQRVRRLRIAGAIRTLFRPEALVLYQKRPQRRNQ